MRVLVLAGGRSAEWEISLVSADWITEQLRDSGHTVTEVVIDRNGAWMLKGTPGSLRIETAAVPWLLTHGETPVQFDVLFPVLHGSYGEDGTVQGLCETAGWKYAGVPVLGSAAAMDKHTMKSLAENASIPVVPWVHIDENSDSCFECLEHRIEKLGMPLFIKPSRLGSSVGISRVESREDLQGALQTAMKYDSRILIEKAVENSREIEVSVIGNGAEVRSSLPGEVLPGKEWYDYQAKYHCPESKLSIPAEIPASATENVRLMAEQAFRLIGGRGFARVDFLMNEKGIWLNEINTIPGFTAISMFPKLWSSSGMEPADLLYYILDEAVSRKEHGLWTEAE